MTASSPVAGEWLVHLSVIRPGTLPEWTGAVAMAGLFGALKRIDEALTTRLHDIEGLKPYTVSTLSELKAGSHRRCRAALEENTEVFIRVTALGDAFPIFRDLLKRLARQVVLLDRAVGEVTNINEVRVLTLGDLFRPAPEPIVRLRFFTPTAFKRPDGALEVLPQPRSIFGSATQRWSRWLGEPPQLDVNRVWIRSHRVRTAPVRFAVGTITGFIGVVTIQGPTEVAQPLWALCRYLEVVGCGVKTAQGMGRVGIERPKQDGDVSSCDRAGSGPLPQSGALSSGSRGEASR